jgi:uncharacterized protein (TIGR02646 family)
MRPVERGEVPIETNGQPKQYRKYQQACPDLINRMGKYCSYCERRIPTNLAVEHIQNKDDRPNLELEWDNFLLGCTNCNSSKLKKVKDDATQSEYYWPHLDNTFRAFVYREGGMIGINPNLSLPQQAKAQRTLELTGLDRCPGAKKEPSKADDRLLERGNVWDMAQLFKNILSTQPNNFKLRELIEKNAIANGFWSVWMTMFQDDPDMLNRLIRALPGTCCGHCFDEAGRPIARRKGGL